MTRNNELLVISIQSMIYNEAEDQCQLLGGSVTRISEGDRSYFYPTLNQMLLQGLIIVWNIHLILQKSIKSFFKIKSVN